MKNQEEKDRAVLMDVDKFIAGTIDMELSEIGAYILLLFTQHQKGNMPLEMMEKVSRGTLTKPVMRNFVKDTHGNWYNKVMKTKTIQREKYREAQSKRSLSYWKTKARRRDPAGDPEGINTRKSISTRSSLYNKANQEEGCKGETKSKPFQKTLENLGLSNKQVEEVLNLMPDITQEYIDEKSVLANSEEIKNPAAFLYKALLYNYARKPKEKALSEKQESPLIKKAKSTGWLSKVEWSTLTEEIQQQFVEDKDASGRITYYLKKSS